MKSFIINYNLSNLKTKFQLLYFLNFTDIIFTLMLLNTGYYIEGNPLMQQLMENTFLSICIKTIIPALLLTSIYHRIQDATIEQLKKSNIVIIISLSLYTVVNLSHIFWLSYFILKK